MSPSTAELARALVASPRWEWRAGMLYVYPVRRGEMPDPQRYCEGDMPPDETCVPLVDDPATAGVLLGMLADEMGRWPIALLALVDEDVEALVLRGGALGEDLPTLGVAVARALLSTWEQP